MKLIIVISVVIIVLLYFLKFGISHLIDYHPGDDGIYFILFLRFKIYTLKYNNIEICRPYRLWDFSWFDGRFSTFLRTLTIGGWPRLTRVMLRMKRGAFTHIFLFPHDPSQFAEEVQKHLEGNSRK